MKKYTPKLSFLFIAILLFQVLPVSAMVKENALKKTLTDREMIEAIGGMSGGEMDARFINPPPFNDLTLGAIALENREDSLIYLIDLNNSYSLPASYTIFLNAIEISTGTVNALSSLLLKDSVLPESYGPGEFQYLEVVLTVSQFGGMITDTVTKGIAFAIPEES